MIIKIYLSSCVLHESALWPAALWWRASGQGLAIKIPAGFCGPGEVWHLGGLFSPFCANRFCCRHSLQTHLLEEHHSLYARLALNTENSPLVDAGDQDFFTSWWIRLFCLLSFFARHWNSGLFIRQAIPWLVHESILARLFIYWRVKIKQSSWCMLFISCICSWCLSVFHVSVTQELCSSWARNPLTDFRLYLSPRHTYLGPLWPFRKWAKLATSQISSLLTVFAQCLFESPGFHNEKFGIGQII